MNSEHAGEKNKKVWEKCLFPAYYCDCQYPDKLLKPVVTNSDRGACVAAGRAGVRRSVCPGL